MKNIDIARRHKIAISEALLKNLVEIQYDDLPEEVVESTKRTILDTFGVMLPPTTLEKSCIALAELAHEAGGKEESSIVGFGGKVPCWMAAFVNGALAHAMDYDDTTEEPNHHPTASTLPAALAIAESIGSVSGKDFITAIALGTDLGIRLASAPKGNHLLSNYPWFPITMFGTFSATAAAGKILRLSEEKMANALGIALHRVFGITEAVVAPDSDIRLIRDGFTNRDGVFSALMAMKGITARKDAIEELYKVYYRDEIDPKAPTLNLGKTYRGTEASIKAWPCCRGAHGCIQAALEIVKVNNIHSDEIEEVILTISKLTSVLVCEPMEVKQNPRSSGDAQFSLFFTVAVAIAKGKVKIAHFLPQNLEDPEVLKVIRKIKHRVSPDFGFFVPSITEIKTKSGKSFSARIDRIYGHPVLPLSKEDLIAKFKDCANYSSRPLAPARLDKLINKILRLEEVGDIREITDFL